MATQTALGPALIPDLPNSDAGKPSISPTLVLGLGGTGTEAVRRLKRRLVWLWRAEEITAELTKTPDGVDPLAHQEQVWRRFEMEGGPPLIQLLAVDTWPWMNRAGQVYLNRHEYAYLGGYNANRVLDNLENFPEIGEWWTWDAQHARPGQIHSGARQIRAIGRLSFYRRYREFKRQVDPRVAAMTSIEARQDVMERGYQVAPSGSTQYVYIVGSICGGTGAGIFLDIAAAMRARFLESADIVGVFVLPSAFIPELGSDIQRDRVQANAYAALKELSYFQNNCLHLSLPGERPVEVPPLFNRIYLLERYNLQGDSLSSKEDLFQLIANQIFLESITDVGSRVREYDVNITSERHEVGGRTLSYSFSSFANSALIMPAEEMQTYGQLRYAQTLITDGLLRPLDPGEQNQLSADVTLGVGHAEGMLTGSGTGGEDEEEEEDDTAVATPRASAESALDQLTQELNKATEKYGLVGAQDYIRRMVKAIYQRAEAARLEVARTDAEVKQLQARLTQMQSNRPWQERIMVGPLSMFAARAVRQRRQAEATLRRNLQNAQGRLSMLGELRDRWDELEKGLGPLSGQVDERARLLRDLAEVRINQEITRLFAAVRIPDQKPYEMLTMLLGDGYIRDTIWPSVMQRPAYASQLTMDAKGIAADPAYCRFELVLAPVAAADTKVYPRTINLAPTTPDSLSAMVSNAAARAVRRLVQPEEYHIRNMLASRESHVQARLNDLFNRCQAFWHYDLDRGGISESSLEDLVLVGVRGRTDHNWSYMLRDHPEFQLVETNDPARIEACRIQHGLPIRYLTNLDDYREKYVEYFDRKAGPLQLSGKWEPDGETPLPDLLDEKPAAKPPLRDVWPQDD